MPVALTAATAGPVALRRRFALLAVVATLAAAHAAANFAATQGFSGRLGPTCVSCHTLAPVPPPPAEAHVDGLPEQGWTAGHDYTLTLRVTGGPTAMPAPQPQGGFDLDVSAGRLHLAPVTDDQIRLIGSKEATYRPAGTLMREWHVVWTAPTLAHEPAPVQVWLAVLAANGNHVIATNTSDGGERFDAAAAIALTVPPSPEAVAAWRAMPLAPPRIEPTAPAAGDAAGTLAFAGEHADANATGIAWRLGDGPWTERSTGTSWRLVLSSAEASGGGNGTLDVRSIGAGRTSPAITWPLVANTTAGPAQADPPAGVAPAPMGPLVLSPVLPLLVLAALARRLHPTPTHGPCPP